MCDFCNNIPNFEDIANIDMDKWNDEYANLKSTIIYDQTKNKYHFWVETYENSSRCIEIYNMNYCPKCGRKLNDITNDDYEDIIKYLLAILDHEKPYKKEVKESLGIKKSYTKEIKKELKDKWNIIL